VAAGAAVRSGRDDLDALPRRLHRDRQEPGARLHAAEGKGLTIDVPLVDTLGDGAVFTTVGDLCRWDAQFYDCTLPVKPDFMERLQQGGKLADGTDLDYAFGLFVDSYRGLRRVQHGGSWGGYRAQLTRFPEARTSIIVLANLAVVPVDEYVAAVADVVLADRLAPEGAGPDAVQPVHFELGDRAGTYVNAGRTIAVRLELDDGAPVLDLTLARLRSGRWRLTCWSLPASR
jgi:hypothetical protein